jgi:fumarylacetoacetate (FAA) hydrolase
VRYVTFAPPDEPLARTVGAWVDGRVVELGNVGGLPTTMLGLLEAGESAWRRAAELVGSGAGRRWPADQVRLLAPLQPRSLRDFYAFEGHVARAFAIRGRPIPAEWYEFPVFYFGNTASVGGPQEDVAAPPGCEELDFELEVACIIGRGGRDIPAERAPEHIFGYAVLNDWSARDLQRAEMRVGLGPAKGKDFATTLGPWIVTPDELEERAEGRPGVYRLAMTARLNGEERSRGNWADLRYSFGEMIARASSGTDLRPGDVLGSGTVGSGCLLELTNGKGPWLQPGDVVELEVERLGVLKNTVASGRWSVAGNQTSHLTTDHPSRTTS